MWARTRTTVQYFLIRSSSRATEAPEFSECFLAYLVKAFFFDRYQFLQTSLKAAPMSIQKQYSLVESPLNLVTEVLSPNSGQRSQASRSLDVTDSTDNDHRGGLNDGNGLNNLPLVHLCKILSDHVLMTIGQ